MKTIEQLLDYKTKVAFSELEKMLFAIGYRFDRRNDCTSVSKIMTGEDAGESYPTLTLYPIQTDNKISAYNINARRDDNYRALLAIRANFYSIHNNHVCEF